MSDCKTKFILCLLTVTFAILGLAGCDSGEDPINVPITTVSDEARQLYLKGLEYQENLRAIEAVEYFQSAVRIDPDFALAHFQLSHSLGNAEDQLDALERAKARLSFISVGEQLMIQAVEAAINSDPATQGKLLIQLVDKFPRDKRARMNLGSFYYGQQNYRKAASEFRKINQLDPEFPPPYNMIGYCYRRLDNSKDAENAFKTYIKLIPNDPNPYDSYAELLMEMGEFKESIDYYRQALAQDSNFFASRMGIASNLTYLGKHEKARDELQVMYNLATDDPVKRAAAYTKALTYLDEGDLGNTLETLRQRLAIAVLAGDSSSVANDMRIIAFIQMEYDMLDEAEASLARSLTASEASNISEPVKVINRRNDLFGRATIAIHRGEIDKARRLTEDYKNLIETLTSPFVVMIAHRLDGQIALAEQNWELAIAELVQSNQENPYNTYRLALAYKGAGRIEEAKETAREIAELNSLMNLNYAIVRKEAINLYKSL